MTILKSVAAAAAALALMTATASAVTVTNTDSKEHTIGVDKGNTESVEKIAAGKSVKLDCPESCGVTGPWGFSWMAKTGDTITTDGKSLIAVGEPS